MPTRLNPCALPPPALDITCGHEFGHDHLAYHLIFECFRILKIHALQIGAGGIGHLAHFEGPGRRLGGAARRAQFTFKGLKGFAKRNLDLGQIGAEGKCRKQPLRLEPRELLAKRSGKLLRKASEMR